MTAVVIVLAEYRERKASVQMTFDPLGAWLSWVGFWMGAKR